MTFAMSKELQFLAGHRFYVKLTPMKALRPYYGIYFNWKFLIPNMDRQVLAITLTAYGDS